MLIDKLTTAKEIFSITKWFRVYFCPSWRFGWDFSSTMVINPAITLNIAIIPFFMVRIGVSKCSY